mmetsp:Transcript_54659/g.97194  ORF Transcript_54659/g.97194 Transcript_54659/m.97194 type:complete len:85 (-) Transcript_54659:297-551(-)
MLFRIPGSAEHVVPKLQTSWLRTLSLNLGHTVSPFHTSKETCERHYKQVKIQPAMSHRKLKTVVSSILALHYVLFAGHRPNESP